MQKLILFVIGVICLIVPIVWVNNCIQRNKEKEKLENSQIEVEFTIENIDSEPPWGDGRIVSHALVYFTNKGIKPITSYSYKVVMYDEAGEQLHVNFSEYSSGYGKDYDKVEYATTSNKYSISGTGQTPVYKVVVTDIKVNGFTRPDVIGYR